ncbi:MAG: tRNA (adenosine(37)-N6)-dimethylallyltransferase MiaA, partial [Pseudomonadota bacterium]
LREEATKEETIEAGAQATRNYAKRQYTWFRRQSDADWPRVTIANEADSVDMEKYFAGLLHN